MFIWTIKWIWFYSKDANLRNNSILFKIQVQRLTFKTELLQTAKITTACSRPHFHKTKNRISASGAVRSFCGSHVPLLPLLSPSSTSRRRTLSTASWRRTQCGPWRTSTPTSTTGSRLPGVCPGTGCLEPSRWGLGRVAALRDQLTGIETAVTGFTRARSCLRVSSYG